MPDPPTSDSTGQQDHDTAASLEAAREASLVSLSDAWTELRGYVAAAVEDGQSIDAASLAAYMDELKARARKPLSDAIKRLGR